MVFNFLWKLYYELCKGVRDSLIYSFIINRRWSLAIQGALVQPVSMHNCIIKVYFKNYITILIVRLPNSIIFLVESWSDLCVIKYPTQCLTCIPVTRMTFRMEIRKIHLHRRPLANDTLLNMQINKEKIRSTLHLLDEGERASQVSEIVNNVYGSDTVSTNYA